jgi:hypothetical protein
MRSGEAIAARPVTMLFILGVVALSGCAAPDELNTPTAARLRGIATYYLDLTFARNGKGPANEQELKRHLRKQERSDLISNGVDPQAIDSTLFVSDRDQEPFVVLYGQSITRITADAAPLVAHEKTGKDGKRIAVLANSKLRLVDDAGLQDLMKSAKP